MSVPGFDLNDIEFKLTTALAARNQVDQIRSMMGRLEMVLRSVQEVDILQSKLDSAKSMLVDQMKHATKTYQSTAKTPEQYLAEGEPKKQ